MACRKMTFLIIFVIICAFSSVNALNKVIDLTEDNWKLMLKDEWMVEFYAPWCPACKGLTQTWKDFATWSKDLGISVAKVDVTTSPGLSGRFMVTALPTIFHVLNGEFRQYKFPRDKESFISFIDEKKWKAVDPVPNWQSPNSIQMSVVSSFFKLSQVLRHLHNTLMDEYGLPSWGSYLIFSLATIFLGVILGLILVCMIDLIYPQKYPKQDKNLQDSTKDKLSDDELADDIRDDLIDEGSDSEGEKFSSSEPDEEKKEPNSKPNSPNLKKRKSRKE